jgi:hypothetical protein
VNSLCELTARSFSRGSFLTFPGLKDRFRFHVELSFATQQRNGLLLYNGRYNERFDFLALEIVNSTVRFSFSLGSNLTVVETGKAVSDGVWHTVSVQYFNKVCVIYRCEGTLLSETILSGGRERRMTFVRLSYTCEIRVVVWLEMTIISSYSFHFTLRISYFQTATVSVDKCDVILTLENPDEFPRPKSCAGRGLQILEERCNLLTESCQRFLDLTGPLYIGGLPAPNSPYQIQTHDFLGCVKNVFINHKFLDLNK